MDRPEPVPYLVHEGILARMERSNRRLFIIVLVLIVVLAASWIGFVVYESQFEEVSISQDVSQDADGGGNNSYNGEIVGGDYYGQSANQDNG